MGWLARVRWSSRSRLRVLPIRRGFVALASVVLALLWVTGVAAAAPTVTLKVKALPIPGFPGTGDALGAGADVEVQVTISGSEYGGYPSPLTGINLYSPSGSKITPTGFATCADGANDASVTSFTVKVGAAYRRGKQTVSYFTQPKQCPRGGFPAKLEMKFLSGEVATVTDSVPCPRRRG